MKRALFIDRDGTLIAEPHDFRIDEFEKLKPLPGVFTYLGLIARETDYELVMVTNQDGLGTESFPDEGFYRAHDFLMRLFGNEGIDFEEVLIDKSFVHENKPTRKPNIGMLTRYLDGDYDMTNSFVIGDRITEVELAKNLGAKAIFVKNPHFEVPEAQETLALVADNWHEIYEFLRVRQMPINTGRE